MPFAMGSKGQDVLDIQKKMNDFYKNNKGYTPLVLDGIYGPKTDAAYKQYQADQIPTSVNWSASRPQTTTQNADGSITATINDIVGLPKTLETFKGSIPPATSTGPDISGLSSVNFNASPALAPYVDPFAEKLSAALDRYLNAGSFSYNPSSDAGLKAAQQNAMAAVDRNAARRGMLYSDSNKSQLGQASMALIPQFEAAAFNKWQSGMDKLFRDIQTLQGLSTAGYNKYRDTVGDTRYADETKYNRGLTEQQQYANNVGRFYQDFQAEINKVQGDNDPSNDWQIPMLQSARQQKIQGIEANKQSAAKTDWDRAMDLWRQTGVANDYVSSVLGVPKGAKTADYQNMIAGNARSSSGSSSSKPTDITSMGTPDQLMYYNNAFNYLLEQNGGDGYKAYQQLLREGKDYNASMGGKLYNELGRQLQAYGKSQGTPNVINNTTNDYKNDPDFGANVQYIAANPETALDDILKNSAQLIKDYGVDGYTYLLKLARGE
jgi:hypothetical protein